MSTVTLEIDPKRRILTGEAAGRSARSELGLDAVDQRTGTAVVRIDTPVVTSSFIMGLFEPSVRSLGLAGFKAKYAFEASPSVRESILTNAQRVLDEAG
ncbi:MAG: hypothetical protein WDN49_18840 [Acetobacteraceae bacterium]